MKCYSCLPIISALLMFYNIQANPLLPYNLPHQNFGHALLHGDGYVSPNFIKVKFRDIKPKDFEACKAKVEKIPGLVFAGFTNNIATIRIDPLAQPKTGTVIQELKAAFGDAFEEVVEMNFPLNPEAFGAERIRIYTERISGLKNQAEAEALEAAFRSKPNVLDFRYDLELKTIKVITEKTVSDHDFEEILKHENKVVISSTKEMSKYY